MGSVGPQPPSPVTPHCTGTQSTPGPARTLHVVRRTNSGTKLTLLLQVLVVRRSILVEGSTREQPVWQQTASLALCGGPWLTMTTLVTITSVETLNPRTKESYLEPINLFGV